MLTRPWENSEGNTFWHKGHAELEHFQKVMCCGLGPYPMVLLEVKEPWEGPVEGKLGHWGHALQGNAGKLDLLSASQFPWNKQVFSTTFLQWCTVPPLPRATASGNHGLKLYAKITFPPSSWFSQAFYHRDRKLTVGAHMLRLNFHLESILT